MILHVAAKSTAATTAAAVDGDGDGAAADDDVEMEQKEGGLGGDGQTLSTALVSEIEAAANALTVRRKAETAAAAQRAVFAERIAAELAVRTAESYPVHCGVDRGVECVELSASA